MVPAREEEEESILFFIFIVSFLSNVRVRARVCAIFLIARKEKREITYVREREKICVEDTYTHAHSNLYLGQQIYDKSYREKK